MNEASGKSLVKGQSGNLREAPWLSGSVLVSGAKDPRIGSAQGQNISCYACCSLGQ